RYGVPGKALVYAHDHMVLVQGAIHHRNLALAERVVQHGRDVGHAYAQPRRGLAVDDQLDLATLVFDAGVHVDEFGQRGHGLLHPRHPGAQQRQIARQQRVVVRAAALPAAQEDVLLRHQEYPRAGGVLQPPAQAVDHIIGADIAFVQRLELYRHEAAVAAPAPARMHRDAGHGRVRENHLAEVFQLGHRGLERRALVDAEKSKQLTGVLLRQEALGNHGVQIHVQADGGRQQQHHDASVRERPGQTAPVMRQHGVEAAPDRRRQPPRPALAVLRLQQPCAHHGGKRQRHHQRHQDGGRKGHRELAEQPPDHAAHQQDGNEYGHQRQAHGQHREADFARAAQRRPHGRGALLDVVLENIMRHIEQGASPMRAALRGSREVGFTVLSMSLSLVAVFIPILLMGGVVGRLFREFAVTLSAAILVSLVVSLTLTPMMCARLLQPQHRERRPGRLSAAIGRGFDAMLAHYRRSLSWALAHGRIMMLLLAAAIGLNVYLYAVVPKGFLPQQDTGQLLGFFRVDQGTSFQATVPKLEYFRKVILSDPAVASITVHAGGRGGSNSSFMSIQLKPLDERNVSANDVVNRLRGRLQNTPGARVFLVPQQDIFLGGGQGSGSYDYTLLSGDLSLLRAWMPRVQQAMAALPELVDVDSSVEDKGRQIELVIDREAATRLGIRMADIAAVLNNSFSQRQVSVMYGPLNQYHVVMG